MVVTSATVAATRSRREKVAALADLFTRLGPDDVAVAAPMLAGEVRQGRVGVGWATVAAAVEEASRRPGAERLTLARVDHTIDEIAALTGPGSTTARRERLVSLFERAEPDEADLLARLLVGELRQGALASLVADALASTAGVPAAVLRRALMFDGDLSRIARLALIEGRAGLEQVRMRVGRPVGPMLASTAPDVAHALDGFEAATVEWKLDGIRLQAHRREGEVHLFTRNLHDVTDRLGAIGRLVAELPGGDLVLDGEVIGVAGDRPELFQDTAARVRAEADEGVGLTVSFFDCLHADGIDLVDRSLAERRAALTRHVGHLAIASVPTVDPGEAAAVLADALARGHEGVVVKDLASPYAAGRRGASWRKVKPVHTLDLVVLAAEWGHGRRTGWLSNLHLGARDPDGRGDRPFVMVGKTFKGLTDEMLAWQTEALLEREVARDGHVVTVHPELVVEVGLDGVQRSSRYPGGVALRFARVRAHRPDKDAATADTLATVRALLPGS